MRLTIGGSTAYLRYLIGIQLGKGTALRHMTMAGCRCAIVIGLRQVTQVEDAIVGALSVDMVNAENPWA